jgi:hypothetical protein
MSALPDAANAPAPLIQCRVKIKTADTTMIYVGLFRSTVDAVVEAARNVGDAHCSITVRAI